MGATNGSREEKLSRRCFVKSAAVLGAGIAAAHLANPNAVVAGDETGNLASTSDKRGPTWEAPGPGSFSIFWITDTQFLSETNPALYKMTTEWIVKNWETYNGRLVVHTGDLVQDGSEVYEWQNADEAMSVLLDNKIPYTWCAGNHDDLSYGDPTSGWIGNLTARSLDPANVAPMVNGLDYATWVDDYHDAMNTAVSFTSNGLKFLVLNLEWNAQADVLAWVEDILDDPRYSDHRFILAPHAYIDSSGSANLALFAEEPEFTSELLYVLGHYSSRIFLTLNGHFPTECGYNTPYIVDNRNQLMFDRQDCTDMPGEPTGRGADSDQPYDNQRVGGSTITILTFKPDDNQISVRTFDVYKGEWRSGETEQYAVTMFPTAPPLPRFAPD